MIRITDPAKALLAVLSIFVMGVAVGCGLDRTILAPPAGAAVAGVRHGEPRHHDEVLAELRVKLGLSAEQSASVQKVFAAHQDDVEEAWAEVHAKLGDAMQETTTEIEGVLDAAQIEQLHAWLAERHGQRSGHLPGRQH